MTFTSREMAVLFWFRVSMPATRKAVAAGRLSDQGQGSLWHVGVVGG